MNLTFTALRFANVQRNKEWDPEGKIPASFRALELAGEVGELCNIIKKLVRESLGLKGSRATFLQLAQELGDAQICLDLLAMQYSVDLGEATRAAFNDKSRELGWETEIIGPGRSFAICNICATKDMCTQEEHCGIFGE